MRRLEHGEVLHHAEAGHGGQHLAQLVERLAVASAQRVEQGAPTFVGERLEDARATSPQSYVTDWSHVKSVRQ